MKKSLNKLMLGAALMAVSGLVSGHVAAQTADIDIEATIIQPITITQTAALRFGDIIPDAIDPGTMLVGDDGATFTPSAELDYLGGAGAGTMEVGGATDRAITIEVDDPTATLTGPGDDMTVGSFTFGAGANTAAVEDEGTSVMEFEITSSPAVIRLGGTLTVGAAQVAGDYAGAISVSASYQ